METKPKSSGQPIQDIIRQLVGITAGEIQPDGIVCTVKEVTGSLCTCTPIDGSPDFYDVRLQTSEADGLLFVPVVGSVVTISLLNKNVAYVSQYSALESIKFRDGGFGGLVKVISLTEKLNNLENDINALKTVFESTWIVSPNDGGAALKAAVAAWAGQQITPTQRLDIENDKITHG